MALVPSLLVLPRMTNQALSKSLDILGRKSLRSRLTHYLSKDLESLLITQYCSPLVTMVFFASSTSRTKTPRVKLVRTSKSISQTSS